MSNPHTTRRGVFGFVAGLGALAALPAGAALAGSSDGRLRALWAEHERLTEEMRGQPDHVLDVLIDKQLRIERVIIEAPCRSPVAAQLKLLCVEQRLGLSHTGLRQVIDWLGA